MKKFLSLVLALLMMISCVSMIAADDTAIADEAETTAASAYDFEIEFLEKYGIYKGGEPAEADIQRYQMALFVARIATGWTDDATWEDGTLNSSEFKDIDTDPANLYLGAISYANQQGIIEGYGDGNFGPYDGITYQDALTMLVRVLGWQNLKYPWGVIEQAVKLGLTDGITGVAYTDILTRAEVAKLVYNSLFIEGKDGLSLAYKNFEMEDGWQTVIITGSPLATYGSFGAKVAGGKVGFSILNEDGSIGNTQYVASAAELGLEGNDATIQLGYVYKVIFEHNNRNLAKVLAYKSLYLDTIWNMGQTDDEGNAVATYPIEAFLAGQKIVSKYSDDEYYYGTGYATDEFILISAETSTYTTSVKTDKAQYGVDWRNGNIVKLAWNGNVPSIQEVVWYYHATLDTYFKYAFDVNVQDGTLDVVTHYMTEEDYDALDELLKEVLTVEVSVGGQYTNFNLGNMTYHTAYASLALFDANEDGVADRGYYEKYGFGRVTLGSQKCTACNANVNTITFSNVGNEPAPRIYYADWWNAWKTYGTILNESFFNLDNVSGSHWNADQGTVDAGYGLVGNFSYTFSMNCNHLKPVKWVNTVPTQQEYVYNNAMWFNPDYDLDGATSVVGMWNWDEITGEVRVIKTVTDKANTTDKDTYTSKGIVRAWSVSKASVTIIDEDGTELELKSFYQDLYHYERHWNAAWPYAKVFAQRIEPMYMNFVNYMVVDGVLVSIWLDGNDTENVIVVDEYLGIDSEDGLITVAGYMTNSLKRKEFKLLAIDSWIAGDWYNTMNQSILETMAKTFSLGAVLTITSVDAETGAYNVDITGQYDASGKFVIDTTSGLKNNTITLDFTGAANNQYYKNGTLTNGASDVEVVVILPYNNGSATIAKFTDFGAEHDVHTATGTQSWYIKGTKINGAADRHVIVAEEWRGFTSIGGGKVSVVQILDIAGAGYAQWSRNGYYITGATNTTFLARDFATGSDIYVTATNMKVVDYGLYVTHDDHIVSTLEDATNGQPGKLASILVDCYGLNTAKYGDGQEWVMGTITPAPQYNHLWVHNYIIPAYAKQQIQDLKDRYGEGTDLYNQYYDAFRASFFVGYADNDAGVKFYNTSVYGQQNARFFYWKSNADGTLDYSYGDNGIRMAYVGNASSQAWQDTAWNYAQCTWYYIINTKNASIVFLADVGAMARTDGNGTNH